VRAEKAGEVYTDENGKKYSYYEDEEGKLVRYDLDSGNQPAPGGPDENARNLARQRFGALKAAGDAAANDPGREGSVMGGIAGQLLPDLSGVENPFTSIYANPFNDFLQGMKTCSCFLG
jgi:hypothetical protein